MHGLINRKIQLTFDTIRHTNDDGQEYWFARELMPLLGYSDWRNFENVIKKATDSIKNSYQQIGDHFVEINKMIKVAGGTNKEALRKQRDYKLTRRACYAIAQNGDPKKEEIALAQSYFAIQTRKQELQEQRQKDIQRVVARRRLSETEKKFSGVLNEHGVDSTGIGEIRSAGDEALFNKSTREMKHKLNIPINKPLADRLPTITLKAKDLAAEITTFNTQENSLVGKDPIKSEHINNNQAVRQLLNEKGIYPELLPAEEDIKKLENRISPEELNEFVTSQSLELDEITIDIRSIYDENELVKLKTLIEDNPGNTKLNILYGSISGPKQIIRTISINSATVKELRKYLY